MSKITNDGLTRMIFAVPIWQQWASKGSDIIHVRQIHRS